MSGPYFAEGTPAVVELEAMVDKVGLRNVVAALAHIAYAKADHLRSNWQDKVSAVPWTRDGNKLDKLATSLSMEH